MMTNGHAMVAAAATVSKADLSIRFSPEQERLILDTCCGGASKSEANALLAIAEARGLNPLLGECYFVKRWDNQKRQEVWSVQASIDSLRIKAEQTGLYAGQDEPEYEYDDRGGLVLARVRVHRKDWPRPAVGVARWSEYVQTTKEGKTTRFWAQMPHNQLAKCAEALALRKAFPAVLAKLYTPEEMAQAENDARELAPRMSASVARQLPAAPPDDEESRAKQADMFARLAERIDQAESMAALNDIAKETQRAHKARLLTDETFAALKKAVTTKRALVQPPQAPPALASEPASDDADRGDAYEGDL